MTPLFVAVARVFLSAWYLMLGIGIVHAEVLHSVRPCGYWVAMALTITLGWFIEVCVRAALSAASE